jgi:hypothetical protein
MNSNIRRIIMNNKFQVLFLAAFIFIVGVLFSQEKTPNFPVLKGPYLGQKPPALKPELFAPNFVSVREGVHGNIVFSPDFTEAAWSPNYLVDDKHIFFRMEYSDGKWTAPAAVYLREGCSHGEPFYSYDGNRFYFLSGQIGASKKTENETIWYLEKKNNGWSEPKLLTPVLDSFKMHWQFSLDKEENLYFGGESSSDESGEIYFSKFEKGKYQNPVKLPENINTSSEEFSPFISPNDDYLIFTRAIMQENAPPQMNLFISFRDKSGRWQKAKNLTEKIEMPAKTPFIMMSQARITPDGKYLFFTFFNGKGHMVYWVDARIIENLNPKEQR